MAAPSRTSVDEIVRIGGEILEQGGVAGLTMQAVAQRAGVRAPSLYKHVAGRDALVRLIAEDAAQDLGRRIDAAAPPGTPPREALAGVARVLRTFAAARPAAFRVIFDPGTEGGRAGPEVAARAAATVLRIAEELAGPAYALEGARTLTAWASGFVAMELAGAFGLGGEVDRAFEFGVERLADALAVADRSVSPSAPR